VIAQAQAKGMTSDEHFTVDGTLIEAWASLQSFQPKDQKKDTPTDDPGNPTVNFHGQKRSKATHASTTDTNALLARKGNGKEARLSYNGNLLTENRNGLIVNAEVFQANGTAERDAALVMLRRGPIPGRDSQRRFESSISIARQNRDAALIRTSLGRYAAVHYGNVYFPIAVKVAGSDQIRICASPRNGRRNDCSAGSEESDSYRAIVEESHGIWNAVIVQIDAQRALGGLHGGDSVACGRDGQRRRRQFLSTGGRRLASRSAQRIIVIAGTAQSIDRRPNARFRT